MVVGLELLQIVVCGKNVGMITQTVNVVFLFCLPHRFNVLCVLRCSSIKKFKIFDRLWVKFKIFWWTPNVSTTYIDLFFTQLSFFCSLHVKSIFFFQSTRFLMDPELSTSNIGCIMTKLNFSVFFILSCQSSTNKSSGCYRR